jgi:hypothetical protein
MIKLACKLCPVVLFLTAIVIPIHGQRRRACCVFAIPYWTGQFSYLGKTYFYRMVGTDPSVGPATTQVPVIIIPIRFRFPVIDAGGTQTGTATTNDPSTPLACAPSSNNGNSITTLILNSPLFISYPFSSGTTQYVDAYQRSNFWSKIATPQPQEYHVLLGGVTIAPPQTVDVPDTNSGTYTQQNCGISAYINKGWFDPVAKSLISNQGLGSDVLPLFVAYNALYYVPFQGTLGGWHGGSSSQGQIPYVVAAYVDNPSYFGITNAYFQDVYFLSHELAEWLADPFVDDPSPTFVSGSQVYNQVPKWKPGCDDHLEVGDPVNGAGFTATLNGFNYHLTDLAFLSWFSQESPSSAQGSQYTLLGGPGPAAICP